MRKKILRYPDRQATFPFFSFYLFSSSLRKLKADPPSGIPRFLVSKFLRGRGNPVYGLIDSGISYIATANSGDATIVEYSGDMELVYTDGENRRYYDCPQDHCLLREADEMARPRVTHAADFYRPGGNDRLGRARYLLFQPAQRRYPKIFGFRLRHFWRGAAALVSFFGQTVAASLSFPRGFPSPRCLVVDDSTQTKSRLGAGICPAAVCHDQRRSGGDS